MLKMLKKCYIYNDIYIMTNKRAKHVEMLRMLKSVKKC